jgi:hypothetical protein
MSSHMLTYKLMCTFILAAQELRTMSGPVRAAVHAIKKDYYSLITWYICGCLGFIPIKFF